VRTTQKKGSSRVSNQSINQKPKRKIIPTLQNTSSDLFSLSLVNLLKIIPLLIIVFSCRPSFVQTKKNTKTEEDTLNLRTLKLNSTQEKRKKALPLLRNTAHRIAPLPISLSLSLSLSLSSSSVLVGASPNANETRRRYTQLNSTQLNSTSTYPLYSTQLNHTQCLV